MQSTVLGFIAALTFHVVSADIIFCGDKACSGESPYCCELDDGTIGCCWNYYYQMWWFWVIWMVILIMVLACSFSCWRRRRAQRRRYVVMNNSAYPTYGTVVHAAPTSFVGPNQPPGYSAVPGYASAPNVVNYPYQPAGAATPVKPPAYEQSSQPMNPPPYS